MSEQLRKRQKPNSKYEQSHRDTLKRNVFIVTIVREKKMQMCVFLSCDSHNTVDSCLLFAVYC